MEVLVVVKTLSSGDILRVPLNNGTQALIIVRSGWEGFFHAIVEDGELTQVHSEVLNAEQIFTKYGVKIE